MILVDIAIGAMFVYFSSRLIARLVYRVPWKAKLPAATSAIFLSVLIAIIGRASSPPFTEAPAAPGLGVAIALWLVVALLLFKRPAQAARAKHLKAERESSIATREWTSTKDGHTFRARYVRQDMEAVFVRREDGKTAKLPKDKLCEADKQYVQTIED